MTIYATGAICSSPVVNASIHEFDQLIHEPTSRFVS
jgi:hypothetical protein